MLRVSQLLLPSEAENRSALKLFPRNTEGICSRAIKTWKIGVFSADWEKGKQYSAKDPWQLKEPLGQSGFVD